MKKEASDVLMEEKMELVSDSVRLPLFRKKLQDFLMRSHMTSQAVDDTTLAVNEALTNVIRHSYREKPGKIEISFRDFVDRVEVQIRDYGEKFDPKNIPPPVLPPKKPGGLGLLMIQKLVDKAWYNTECSKGNALLLTKYKKDKKEN